MRVVGGSARGRKLVAPAGDRTRPTGARAREAVFNALWSRGVLEGAEVADLFAGSGAMGIEALSRGASRALFVEADREARRAISTNLEVCGLRDRGQVVAGPVERVVAEAAAAGRRFDLVFCDPPYGYSGWSSLLGDLPASLVVMEAGGPVELPGGWEMVRSARYGAAWMGFAVGPGG